MTKEKIRDLDTRVRQHMVTNGQLSKQEVENALASRDDLKDLKDSMMVCETPTPQETVVVEDSEEESEDEE